MSESEAIWMLSDSESRDSNSEDGCEVSSWRLNGEDSLEDLEDDSDEEEEETPNRGLLIPGFNKVVRRSSRLEIRKRNRAMLKYDVQQPTASINKRKR